MGRSGRKPRKKLDPKQVDAPGKPKKRKETDWSFADIVRSKTRHR